MQFHVEELRRRIDRLTELARLAAALLAANGGLNLLDLLATR